jgi:uncharacterized membrane protein
MDNNKLKILFAGESWISYGVHLKGFGTFETGAYEEGLEPLRKAFLGAGHDLTYLPNHKATTDFPFSIDELSQYDVVILSDLPADTLLLHPDTFNRGQRTPNRLRLISEFVQNGGGFLMVGGYMSFSGIQGKANFHASPLKDVLPVKMYGYDDRMESPEGVTPVYTQAGHPILQGIPAEWPFFLGFNRLIPAEGEVLMTCLDEPFLAVREVGQGRTAAFASDCSPHWAPMEFVNWEYYNTFWNRLVAWLARKI